MIRIPLPACAALAFAWLAVLPAQAADTLKIIRERGHLICGTSPGVAGFSLQNKNGRWEGFDTDICRALSVAIFNDPDKISFVSLSSKDRLTALQTGEIDVLPRTTSWTLGRNVGQGVTFTAVNYYDGQAFLVPRKLGITAGPQLAGATFCVAQGTTSELNLADYFRRLGKPYEPVAFATSEDAFRAYETGRCDAYTTDLSAISANLLKLAEPEAHMVLPEIISKEPLGPWVRMGDEVWFNLVRWTVFALIDAEELGITKANVREMTLSTDPEIKRFLGHDGRFGEALGVSGDWVIRIIATTGNYGESFDRHLGAGSRMHLPRGLNALWTKGGLQYSPPFR